MPDKASTRSDVNAAVMTRGERDDLRKLVHQREKVLKSAVKQRAAELVADFENQLGTQFSFDQDEVWEKAAGIAKAAVVKANAQIAARCRELGIPERFAPGLEVAWRHRGYDNGVKERRAELRRMAQTQVEALEAKAVVEIEMACLEAQTALAVASLTSDAARQFIERLPAIEVLMPKLSSPGEEEPPAAEQLVSSSALRQRRFREKQRLRNGNAQPALRDAATVTGDDIDN
jgi:hypothetical protein